MNAWRDRRLFSDVQSFDYCVRVTALRDMMMMSTFRYLRTINLGGNVLMSLPSVALRYKIRVISGTRPVMNAMIRNPTRYLGTYRANVSKHNRLIDVHSKAVSM